MPNHVTNKIIVDDLDIYNDTGKSILESCMSNDSNFDFEKIIPRPRNMFRDDWQIDNWGTKWNAYNVSGPHDNKVTFDTAWAHPFPIIKALSEKYPNHQFTVFYADEDCGHNLGSYTMINGRVIEKVGFKEGSNEAIAFALALRN